MRTAFREQLESLEQRIVDDLGHAADTLATVAAAVRAPTEARARAIADDGQRLHTSAAEIHAELVTVTARQSPVASDLRLVLSMIELAHHIALVGNQFGLISEQLTRMEQPADPDGTAVKLAEMAELASVQLRKATSAYRTRDLSSARELDGDDDALDALNREICNTTAQADGSTAERELQFRQVLIARSLERIGDNAVDVAEQAEFLLTAELRQFSDASTPTVTS